MRLSARTGHRKMEVITHKAQRLPWRILGPQPVVGKQRDSRGYLCRRHWPFISVTSRSPKGTRHVSHLSATLQVRPGVQGDRAVFTESLCARLTGPHGLC